MAILTFVYVIATIFLAYIAWKTSKISVEAKEISEDAKLISSRAVEISQKQLEKVTELEENRVRPYVIFNIVSGENLVTLAGIKNYGLTAAYNVKVTITPNLDRAFHQENDESVITSETFSLLPPNFEITDSLGGSPDFYQKYEEPIFSGVISYKDINGKVYEEKFQINLNSTSKRLWTSEREIWRCLEDINKNLDKINGSLKK